MKKITLLLFIFFGFSYSQNLTVESGGTLTIEKTGAVTVSGNFTNNGTATLRSDSNEFSSLIVQGTSSGNITYNRYVNSLSGGTGWDLIGSPVNGLQISSFVSTNDAGSSPLATGNGSGAGDVGEYAIGTYDPSNNSWSNYTSSNVSTTQFTPGKGYQMATDSGQFPFQVVIQKDKRTYIMQSLGLKMMLQKC